MVDTSIKLAADPWWVRSRAPWTGALFDRMILKPEHPQEIRVQTIRDSMLEHYEAGKRRLSVNMALIITRTYQETEGMHPALRRALAIRNTFQEIPLMLLPGQLLMGTASSGAHVVDFHPFFLPLSPDEWEDQKDLKTALQGAEQRYVFTPEDRRVFEEEIWPYWRTRAREIYFYNQLRRHYPQAWRYMRYSGSARYSPLVGGGLAHTIQDYASVLNKGLLAIQDEIRAQIAMLDEANPAGMDTYDRRSQYEAMLIAADGMLAYAHRNAELAAGLAAVEPDAERAAELREMSRICSKVPAYPAETWWEALQAFHSLRLGTALSEGADSHSAGRFDRYMLPFLQKDLESGELSRTSAQELLECLFLKWNETRAFKLKLSVGSAGGGNNDKINLGGQDAFGADCTNELSYMLLEAHAHVHLVDPNLSVRVHRNTPPEFLKMALEVVRLGGGLPILINDEVIVPSLVSRCGVKLEHARQYGDVGCQENITDPNQTGADSNGRNNSGWINLPKPVELALFNGVNPLNGEQAGPQTGDPRDFQDMDRFMQAVRAQIEHAVRMNVIANNVYDYVYTTYFPCPFHNLMHPGPRRQGVDINAGGCLYNWTGCLAVGMANAGDMLAAIDHLVYRQKAVTWDELLSALEKDWEGAEQIRKMCIAAPKYGCDDEFADHWVRRMLSLWYEAYGRHATPRGGRFVVGLISMGNYVTLGQALGATPDGRCRGEPLADATSPSRYAPVKGPTAAHRSAARAIDAVYVPNGVTFNQRFNATSVTSRREVSKWADLVRGYMDAGGMQVQYTVVDAQALRRAQENPDDYRDLLVRVGGYSAVFVELSKEVQETIIARTEQGF